MDRVARPLFEAIWSGEPLSVLRAIVKRRPNSIRGCCEGEFPLHHVVREGLSVDHVKYLYDKFPDAIKGTQYCDRLPLHEISAKTPVNVVEFLVDKHPEALMLEGDNEDHTLPIHAAVDNAGVDVVQLLVERYPKSLLEPNEVGRFPMHIAAIATKNPHQLEVVKYLARQCPASLIQRAQYGGDPQRARSPTATGTSRFTSLQKKVKDRSRWR
jgi:hypothetical protein